MATLRTTNLQHPSSAVPNLVLQADGTVSGEALSKFGLGGNVVQTVKTDVFTTASSTYVEVPGLSVTIAPTSASSRILVIADVKLGQINSSDDNQSGHLRITGGNAADYVGDASGSLARAAASTGIRGNDYNNPKGLFQASPVYLDFPNTTDPVTYVVEVRRGGSGNATVNRTGRDTNNDAHARTASSITAIEVAP